MSRKKARGEPVPGDEETASRPVKTEVEEESVVTGLVLLVDLQRQRTCRSEWITT